MTTKITIIDTTLLYTTTTTVMCIRCTKVKNSNTTNKPRTKYQLVQHGSKTLDVDGLWGSLLIEALEGGGGVHQSTHIHILD